MSSLRVVLVVAAALAVALPLVVVLVRTVRADGLGHRPPPARAPGAEGGR